MSDSIKDRIREDLKASMKAKDKARLNVIRMMMAAVKQREVDERISLDDMQVITVLDKMLKQRRESMTQYTQAGRDELADVEAKEIRVIQEFLPQPLTEQEINNLVIEAIAKTGASSIKDMGKVMGIIKPEMQGRADMATVSVTIKGLLSSG